MSAKDVAGLRSLIREVRRTFRLLAGISDKMLENRGLTASLRAVLEFVFDEGASPVPKIASEKSMTRQSVQALVDRLVALGLVETIANPAHKRSVLVALTDRGRETFEAILLEEARLLSKVSESWTEGEAGRAAGTLREFQKALQSKSNGGATNDAEFKT